MSSENQLPSYLARKTAQQAAAPNAASAIRTAGAASEGVQPASDTGWLEQSPMENTTVTDGNDAWAGTTQITPEAGAESYLAPYADPASMANPSMFGALPISDAVTPLLLTQQMLASFNNSQSAPVPPSAPIPQQVIVQQAPAQQAPVQQAPVNQPAQPSQQQPAAAAPAAGAAGGLRASMEGTAAQGGSSEEVAAAKKVQQMVDKIKKAQSEQEGKQGIFGKIVGGCKNLFNTKNSSDKVNEDIGNLKKDSEKLYQAARKGDDAQFAELYKKITGDEYGQPSDGSGDGGELKAKGIDRVQDYQKSQNTWGNALIITGAVLIGAALTPFTGPGGLMAAAAICAGISAGSAVALTAVDDLSDGGGLDDGMGRYVGNAVGAGVGGAFAPVGEAVGGAAGAAIAGRFAGSAAGEAIGDATGVAGSQAVSKVASTGVAEATSGTTTAATNVAASGVTNATNVAASGVTNATNVAASGVTNATNVAASGVTNATTTATTTTGGVAGASAGDTVGTTAGSTAANAGSKMVTVQMGNQAVQMTGRQALMVNVGRNAVSGAVQGSGTNVVNTALQGGNFEDMMKAGAFGAVAGGAMAGGGSLAAGTGGKFLAQNVGSKLNGRSIPFREGTFNIGEKPSVYHLSADGRIKAGPHPNFKTEEVPTVLSDTETTRLQSLQTKIQDENIAPAKMGKSLTGEELSDYANLSIASGRSMTGSEIRSLIKAVESSKTIAAGDKTALLSSLNAKLKLVDVPPPMSDVPSTPGLVKTLAGSFKNRVSAARSTWKQGAAEAEPETTAGIASSTSDSATSSGRVLWEGKNYRLVVGKGDTAATGLPVNDILDVVSRVPGASKVLNAVGRTELAGDVMSSLGLSSTQQAILRNGGLGRMAFLGKGFGVFRGNRLALEKIPTTPESVAAAATPDPAVVPAPASTAATPDPAAVPAPASAAATPDPAATPTPDSAAVPLNLKIKNWVRTWLDEPESAPAASTESSASIPVAVKTPEPAAAPEPTAAGTPDPATPAPASTAPDTPAKPPGRFVRLRNRVRDTARAFVTKPEGESAATTTQPAVATAEPAVTAKSPAATPDTPAATTAESVATPAVPTRSVDEIQAELNTLPKSGQARTQWQIVQRQHLEDELVKAQAAAATAPRSVAEIQADLDALPSKALRTDSQIGRAMMLEDELAKAQAAQVIPNRIAEIQAELQSMEGKALSTLQAIEKKTLENELAQLQAPAATPALAASSAATPNAAAAPAPAAPSTNTSASAAGRPAAPTTSDTPAAASLPRVRGFFRNIGNRVKSWRGSSTDEPTTPQLQAFQPNQVRAELANAQAAPVAGTRTPAEIEADLNKLPAVLQNSAEFDLRDKLLAELARANAAAPQAPVVNSAEQLIVVSRPTRVTKATSGPEPSTAPESTPAKADEPAVPSTSKQGQQTQPSRKKQQDPARFDALKDNKRSHATRTALNEAQQNNRQQPQVAAPQQQPGIMVVPAGTQQIGYRQDGTPVYLGDYDPYTMDPQFTGVGGNQYPPMPFNVNPASPAAGGVTILPDGTLYVENLPPDMQLANVQAGAAASSYSADAPWSNGANPGAASYAYNAGLDNEPIFSPLGADLDIDNRVNGIDLSPDF
jgi:hypothetical protein